MTDTPARAERLDRDKLWQEHRKAHPAGVGYLDRERFEALLDEVETRLAPAPQPQGVNGNPEPKADGRLRIEPCESWGKHVLQFWNGKGWETLHTDYLKIVERMQEQLSRLTSGDAAERERNLEGVEYLGSCGAGRAALADIQRSREEDLSEKLAAAENTIASQRTELARLNREYERQIKVAAAHANLESAATERLAAAQHDLAEARRALEAVRTIFNEADSERLDELDKRDAEADKWKAEGDMYGWNFHKGVASGLTWASFAFHRIARHVDQSLAALTELKDLRAKLTAEVERLRQHARYLQNAERALLDDAATRLEAIVKGEPHAH